MKRILLIITGVGFFCNAYAQRTTKLSDVTARYLEVKNFLVNNDSVQVKAASARLQLAISHLRLKPLNSDSSTVMNNYLTLIQEQSIAMANTGNVNQQRKHFFPISKNLWSLLNSSQHKGKKMYYQRCPMTGVTWLSSESRIANPYYPKNMLGCGEVIAAK